MDDTKNKFSNYLGDISHVISAIQLKEGKARETGNTYYYLEFDFKNGYAERVFISSKNSFGVLNALENAMPTREQSEKAYNDFTDDSQDQKHGFWK